MKTKLGLLAFVMLSTGCWTNRVIPDQRIPHQLSEEACVTIYARQADGKLVPVKVKVPAGWWVASPQVVDP